MNNLPMEPENKSGDTVPLADGRRPTDPTPEQIEKARKLQEEAFKKATTPTAQEVRNERTRQIASQLAEQARKSTFTAAQAAKAQAQLEQAKKKLETDEEKEQADCERLANLLNRYRTAYHQHPAFVNFKWKSHYQASMGYAFLKSSYDTVRSIVDLVDIPGHIAEISRSLVNFLETLGNVAARRFQWDIDFSHLAENYTMALQSGIFNSELQQASVELAEWFQISYYNRFLFKFLDITWRTCQDNADRRAGKEPPSFDNIHLGEGFKKNTEGL